MDSFLPSQLFAGLYEDENSQRVVANAAGVRTIFTKFDGIAINNWNQILEKAYEHKLLEQLVIEIAKQHETRIEEIRLAQLHFLLTKAISAIPNWSVDVLRNLCARCTPPHYTESSLVLKTLDDAILYLSEIPFQPKSESLPILEFAIRVSQKIENNPFLVNHLHQWVRDAGTLFSKNIDLVKIDALFARLQTDDQKPAIGYLLVVVDEDQDNPNRASRQERYRLSVEYGSKSWYANDTTTYRLNEIPAKICELLDEHIEDNDELVQIECFLPTRLLSEPVNLWKRKQTTPITFGERHPITLRSLERVRTNRYLNACKKQLKRFRNQPNTYIRFVEQAACDHTALVRKLEAECCICVGMEFVFQPHQGLGRKLLNVLFEEGIPILLWSRHVSHQGSCETQMQQAIQPKRLDELPNLLHKMRKDYAANHKHICNQLTLLWDDPERIPAKLRSENRLRTIV